jgi:alpha-glucosidase
VHLPSSLWAPYLEHFDSVFAFEVFHAPWDAAAMRAAIELTAAVKGPKDTGAAWVLSNHDFTRLPDRFGEANVRTLTMMLLTLPGNAFVYQGDELGLCDGPGGDRTHDRAGRDGHRHPMQWDATPTGGFTTGTPWLPALDPARRNVRDQRADPGSLLSYCRELIALRRGLGPGLRMIDSAPGVVAYERGDHLVALNSTGEPRPAPRAGAVALETTAGALSEGTLAPHGGAVCERPGGLD